MVSALLTISLLFRIVGWMKPLVMNRFFRVAVVCSVFGGAAGCYALLLVLFSLASVSSTAVASQSSVIDFGELIQSYVTMTSLTACGLVVTTVVAWGVLGQYVSPLMSLFHETLPLLSRDISGKPALDLRNKTPWKS